MMMNDRDREERFEADLRAAMAPEPAGAELRRRILEQAVPRNRVSPRKQAGWAMLLDPRNWRLPVLVELGAVAAAASLAVGVFAGANGLVPNAFMLGTATTATTASASSNSVDLVALAERFGSGRLSARDLVRIIGAGLRGAGETISDSDVAAMTVDGGASGYVRIAAELIAATFEDTSRAAA